EPVSSVAPFGVPALRLRRFFCGRFPSRPKTRAGARAMIAIKPTVADLYHRQTSVEDIQRQLRLDNPHCTEAEIEIRLRRYSLAVDMCKVSRAQTRAWYLTAAGCALNGAYRALGVESPIHYHHEAGLMLHCAKHPVQKV